MKTKEVGVFSMHALKSASGAPILMATIPLPPTINNDRYTVKQSVKWDVNAQGKLYSKGTPRLALKKQWIQFKHDVWGIYQESKGKGTIGAKPYKGKVFIIVEVCQRFSDIDAREKALLDAFNGIFWEDDSQVKACFKRIIPAGEGPEGLLIRSYPVFDGAELFKLMNHCASVAESWVQPTPEFKSEVKGEWVE